MLEYLITHSTSRSGLWARGLWLLHPDKQVLQILVFLLTSVRQRGNFTCASCSSGTLEKLSGTHYPWLPWHCYLTSFFPVMVSQGAFILPLPWTPTYTHPTITNATTEWGLESGTMLGIPNVLFYPLILSNPRVRQSKASSSLFPLSCLSL
jgi:hypothetical protein